MASQVEMWRAEGNSVSLLEPPTGQLDSASAYVLSSHSEPRVIFTWVGASATEEFKIAVREHADELARSLSGVEATVVNEGHESQAFQDLLRSLAGVAASPDFTTAAGDGNEDKFPNSKSDLELKEENTARVIQDGKDAAVLLPAGIPIVENNNCSDEEVSSKVETSGDQSSTEVKALLPTEGQSETHTPSDAKSLSSKGSNEGAQLVDENITAAAEVLPLIRTSSRQSSIVQRFLEAASRNNSRETTPKAPVMAPPASTHPSLVKVTIAPGSSTFSPEELKGMRADSGIDMTCKEDYLTGGDFEKVFGKSRDEFKALAKWRQAEAKKAVGLW